MNELNNNYYQITNPLISGQGEPSSVINEDQSEYPTLVLSQQPDSHGFNERRIVLNEQIKVGRSVARARPTDINGIFDCKVLSRNHAIIWYDNGKVMLRDTKSSNGTYVNNQLLSKGSEESLPREIYSGDIVQFGVEVVENTIQEENQHYPAHSATHGCIIAQVSIYLPDGSELRRHVDLHGIDNGGGMPMSNYYEEQIYQLAQYIQEASHREQTLEKKLHSLHQLIRETQEASDSSWTMILRQDRLLEKLESLQHQMECSEDGQGEEQQSVMAVAALERETKRLLEAANGEKMVVVRRLAEVESALMAAEAECSRLAGLCEALQTEREEQGRAVAARTAEVETTQARLEAREIQMTLELERLRAGERVWADRCEELGRQAAELRERLKTEEAADEMQEHALESSEQQRQLLQQDSLVLADGSDKGRNGVELVTETRGSVGRAVIAQLRLAQRLLVLEADVRSSEDTLDNLVDDTTCELTRHLIQCRQEAADGYRSISIFREEVMRLREQLGMNKGDPSENMTTEAGLEEAEQRQQKLTRSLEALPGLMLEQLLRSHAGDNEGGTTETASQSYNGATSDGHAQTETVSTASQDTQADPTYTVHGHTQTAPDKSLLSVATGSMHVLLQTSTADTQTEQNQSPDHDDSGLVELKQQLKTACDQLDDEKKGTESLRVEVLNIQAENQRLTHEKDTLMNTVEEFRGRWHGNEELASLRRESEAMRERVHEIEQEMVVKRAEYERLWEQHEQLQAAGQKLESPSAALSDNNDELIQSHQREMAKLCEENRAITSRSRRNAALTTVPLIVLLFGVILTLLSLMARPWFPLVTVSAP